MQLARLGGLLVLGSCALLAAAAIAALLGESVVVAGSGAGGLLLTAGLGLLALGAALLGIRGSRSLTSRAARSGLIVGAVGLTAELATARVSASSMLVIVFLIGAAGFGIGSVATVLGLLLSAGRQRTAALTILAGLFLASCAGALTNLIQQGAGLGATPLTFLVVGLAVVGGAIALSGLFRVGLLGLDDATDLGPVPSSAQGVHLEADVDHAG